MLYLAENLKKYRIIKNLTQEDLANYLNIKPVLEGVSYHRAYYDAYVTYILYVTLLNTFGEKTDIVTPRPLVDDNRKYGKVVNYDALSLDA